MKTAIKTATGFLSIEAEEIKLCEITLALHRTPFKRGWSVTHPATGYAIVSKQTTPERARTEAVLRVNSYGPARFLEIIATYPKAPPVDGLLPYVRKKVTAPKADIAGIVDLIAERVGGLTDAERVAVTTALNSRTGQLKAKSPSAFGSAEERLACAAWQGLQPNGFKVGMVSVFSIGHHADSLALFSKLCKNTWPAAFDRDKAALVAAGVW